jgi:hypothetical protein
VASPDHEWIEPPAWEPGREIHPDHSYFFRAEGVPDMVCLGSGILEQPCGCRYLEGVRLDNGEPGAYMGGCAEHEAAMGRVLERFRADERDDPAMDVFRELWEEETA